MKRFEAACLSMLVALNVYLADLRVNAIPATEEAIDPAIVAEAEQETEIAAVPAEIEEEYENAIEPESKEFTVVYKMYYSDDDITALAQMLWGEARGCTEEDKRNCCITACNRADDSRFPDSILGCVSQPNQYVGYSKENPVVAELAEIAEAVLIDWSLKKQGVEVKWNDYNSFWGDGIRNHFYVC